MEDKIPLNLKNKRKFVLDKESIPTVVMVGAILVSGIIFKNIS